MLQVYAHASIEGDEELFTVIKLKNLNGKVVTKYVPTTELLTRQSVMTALTRKGYQLPGDKDKRTAIYEYISTARPKRRAVVVRRLCWIKGRYALSVQACSVTQYIFSGGNTAVSAQHP